MINHDLMRVHNTSKIFDAIRESDKLLTKRQIHKQSNLSWAVVSVAIGKLVEDGHIVEIIAPATNKVGRPAKVYDISDKRNLLIGVEINISGLHVVAIDLKCRILYSKNAMIINNNSGVILNTVTEMIKKCIKELGSSKIIGIGFGLMGVVDTESGIAKYSPFFKNWKDLLIKGRFEKEFGIPVLIESDPNCLALAELNIGSIKKPGSAVVLKISHGIGMAMVLEGRLYKGYGNSAIEFGHICLDLNGPLCSCGKRGCLESYASVSGIAARLRESAKDVKNGYEGISEESMDGDLAILNRLSKAAANDDASARYLFEQAGDKLGISLGNFITMLNPGCVIIGGAFTDYFHLFMERLLKSMSIVSRHFAKTDILLSKLGNNATAIGAATLFIQKRIWEEWM